MECFKLCADPNGRSKDMRRRKRALTMEYADAEEVRARGGLPNADIDIVYRRSRDNDAAFIGISIRALPVSQAFDRWLAMSDPFRFWGQLAALAWQPWLQGLPPAARPSHSLALPRSDRPRRASG